MTYRAKSFVGSLAVLALLCGGLALESTAAKFGKFTVLQIQSAEVDIDSLGDADALIDGFIASASEAAAEYPVVNFYDGGPDGDFHGNADFPNGGGDDFALLVTGCVEFRKAGEVTFAVTSDDGSRLRIDGVDVTVDDGTHGPTTTVGSIHLTKGPHDLELTYFERDRWASLELGVMAGGHKPKLVKASRCQ